MKLAIDQSCSADKTDDLVLYVTVNGQTKRMDPRSTAGLDFNVNVRANDTLSISTSGFECDFSCGEHPADVLNSPNDRIGSIEMAFTGPRFGGTGTIGSTKTYRMKSQTNNTNDRSEVLTMGDYAIKATSKEVPPGSQ